jgi:capsular polysaccharide transport system ATP-binding protein
MIRLTDVVKTYPTPVGRRTILDHVSFQVERGQSLGIMGRNGAGKSTLMRTISGLEKPDSGTVERTMSASWPLGFFGGIHGALTGIDNAKFVARIYGLDIPTLLDAVESFADLGVYFRMPVNTYSAGMRARLSLGISLAVRFDCYLIDEITGAGDHRFIQRCHEALMERKATGTLIMISHAPDTLRLYCDTGVILDGGKLTFYDTVDEMIEAYYAL